MPEKSLFVFLSMIAAGVAGAVGASLLPSDAPAPRPGLDADQSAQLNARFSDLSESLELLSARLTNVESAARMMEVAPRSGASDQLTREDVESIVAELLASDPSSPNSQGSLETTLERVLDARAERARLASERAKIANAESAREGQLAKLQVQLALTDAQVMAVREVFDTQTKAWNEKVASMEQDPNFGPESYKSIWNEAQEATKASMKATLTPAQFDEYVSSLGGYGEPPAGQGEMPDFDRR